VAPYRRVRIRSPGEQAAAQNQFELVRVPVGVDIGREEASVEGPRGLVAQILVCPRAPLAVETPERLTERW
jgi:hypothetical protein